MDAVYTPEEAKDRLSNFRDKSFRPFQREAIEWAMESEKKYRILEAPMGAGKSLLGITCGVMANKSTYLCGTKYLQQQIINDFPESTSLWGRGNYPCLLNNERTCDQCVSTKINPCPLKRECYYKIAKQKAIESNLRVLNFSYFLSETAYAGRFRGNPLTIVDESDSLEGVLVGQISLQFSERALYRLGLQSGPERLTATSKMGIEPWIEFGQHALYKSRSIAKSLQTEIDSWETIESDHQLQTIKEKDYFVHLSERCEIFLNNIDKSWILQKTERQGSKQGMLTFRPTWISEELAYDAIWKYSDNWILMSATFPPKSVLAKTLGIPEDEIDYKALPSTFPIENRPINIWPVANLNNKTLDGELPKLIKGIKKILDIHKGEKGVCHTVSYKLAKQIHDGINSPRLIIHTPFDRQDVIDEFIENDDDSVLLSPSVERGVNLPYDKCRFVICAKMSFANLGDAVVSRRLHSGPIGQLWYLSTAMLNIMQSCGRGVRAADDFCVAYLIDQQIERVYQQYPSLWPSWFREAETWESNELI